MLLNSMSKSAADKMTLREPTNSRMMWFVLAIWGFMTWAMVTEARGGQPVLMALAILLSVAVFGLWWRLRSVRVAVSAQGLTVVNPLRTRHFAWHEVSRFELGYPEARFWNWSPVVESKTGIRMPMPAIQSPNPVTQPNNDFGERAVAVLNRGLELAIRNGGDLVGIDLRTAFSL